MKYYKKVTVTEFYDGHGVAEDGGTTLEVVTEDEIKKGWNCEETSKEFLDFINTYNGMFFEEGEWGENYSEEEEDDEPKHKAGDGYNCDVNSEAYTEISHQKYLKLREIIKTYNKELR